MAHPELPGWLTEAPEELRAGLMAGYEKYGDDIGAIIKWFQQLETYRQFWGRVDSRSDPLRPSGQQIGDRGDREGRCDCCGDDC